MSVPHDPERIGETWNPVRLAVFEEELNALREWVVVSGGWAWHFMTPSGHLELKHAHDHKDADLFVRPHDFPALVGLLKSRGYERIWTRFDSLPESRDFYRYGKTVEQEGEAVKILLDVFVSEVPSVEASGFQIVEPKYLLSLYGHKHTSDRCFAVRIATDLLARGLDPVGNPAMADYTAFK